MPKGKDMLTLIKYLGNLSLLLGRVASRGRKSVYHPFNSSDETIATSGALAGRASYLELSGSRASDSESQTRLSQKMLAACYITLLICKDSTALNELTLWLVHENLLLSSLVLGVSSPVTWQRLGELSTNIFELGVHRDTASSTPLPRFILESRRRLFAAAYHFDKSIATFLGRPPRIS
ncbi:Transcription factor [Penicillium cf. griseofulvum]|uniref:Transcription factor n=1 Tax=Penicillium cf. griseofulvum TaxID=2972120 RepID=A0A9W9MSL7_9EURO|nr:Transcription factor [Penicillium cf. griseofulvum]KAJ5440330.1 Transcription factor [Penicillium cf. griseofulvum]KAJ5448378.1 Transcription factor [Penicillium cf. griseofulvum]